MPAEPPAKLTNCHRTLVRVPKGEATGGQAAALAARQRQAELNKNWCLVLWGHWWADQKLVAEGKPPLKDWSALR